MLRHPRNKVPVQVLIAIALAAIGLTLASPAFSRESNPQIGSNVPCAVLKDFEGDVEVLDASRVALVHTQKNAGVPCGGWVSITRGWAKLKHRDGHWFRLGADSFVQASENNLLGENQGDHLVLFRGELWADADRGAGEFRVTTANGRVRLNDAAGLVIFNPGEQETQLIALENKGTLENRFESSRIVTVHAGEASSLNFGLLRVIPSQPRAVSVASLRQLMASVHATDAEVGRAVAATRNREERKFASVLTPNPDEPDRRPAAEEAPMSDDGNTPVEAAPVKGKGKRKGKGKARKVATYDRNVLQPGEKAKIRQHWVNRMTAGEPVGERILFPDKFYGQPQKVQVEVEDPDSKLSLKRRHANSADAEKKRLIEELSQIREN